MDTEKFNKFLDSLCENGENGLIESIRAGFSAIFEANISKIQPWAEEISQISAQDKEDWARQAYEIALKYVDGPRNEIGRVLRRVAPHAEIKISVKKLESWLDKVVNRGKDASTIRDLLRCAVLVDDPAEVEEVVKRMNKEFPVYQQDYKASGAEPEYGYYGSYHMDVQLPNGLLAEIQVMPRRLWTYKRPAHKIYQSWRSAKRTGGDWKGEQERSKHLFRYGNIPKYKSTDTGIRERVGRREADKEIRTQE